MGVINIIKLAEDRDYHIIYRAFLKLNDKENKYKVIKINKYKVYCKKIGMRDLCVNAMEYVANEINKKEGIDNILKDAEISVTNFSSINTTCDDEGNDKEVLNHFHEPLDLERPSARIHYNEKENLIDYITIEGFHETINCIIIDKETRYYKDDEKSNFEISWVEDFRGYK